jgi:hypothetical protein
MAVLLAKFTDYFWVGRYNLEIDSRAIGVATDRLKKRSPSQCVVSIKGGRDADFQMSLL